jgi:hypothetical protein
MEERLLRFERGRWDFVEKLLLLNSDVLALAWPESHGFGFLKSEARPELRPLLWVA